MTDTTDGDLVARYRRGEVEALAALVERYRRPLFAYILNMTSPPESADEVFQEVWFRAIGKLSGYKQKNFLGWLIRIAHNLVIDRARRRKPDASLDEELGEDGPSRVDTLAAPTHDPALSTADRDLGSRISAAVKALPPEQREVFVLRAHGDVPFREIAVLQGVSINTALARMQYALGKLRSLLREDYAQLGR